jgi:NADH:ubiquinone oxidoreductase subunit 4 (subunit M)
VLAAFGAIWGSLKALSHDKVPELIAYAGLSMYSILWWHLAQVGKFTAQSLQYAVAVGLVSLGLILAWNSLRSRYAELDLTRVGSLDRCHGLPFLRH